ncbi:nucleoside deaminase [Piscinibacter defluvii]|uniref:nucleoside deaminase n=1 Tax=Piscinibacter defluvii TaxID=1796922 RepID=UPI000FDF426E|nr:nucleoside deaminase [Piscinibacter defluvii]
MHLAAQAPIRGGRLSSNVSRHTRSTVPVAALHQDRRTTLAVAVALIFGTFKSTARAQSNETEPERRWYEAAVEMKRIAESWGDQSYGAVLVLNGALVGEGPSQVVKNQNPDAHAEREAIRDAQRRLGREMLQGAILYSTSRPCGLCESAAARAGISRMYFGPSLTDAGAPSQATL